MVAGTLAAGAVLTLDGIAREYAVSRAVAREAIRVLESMGMVTSRRRVGVTVLAARGLERLRPADDPLAPRSRQDRAAQLLSLSELRRGFEPVAASLAAQRAERRAVPAAGDGGQRHGGARPRRATSRPTCCADVAFHRTLLEASGNEMFRALDDVVAEVLAGRTHHEHDAGDARTRRRSRCTTRWPAPYATATPGSRRARHASDHRRGGRRPPRGAVPLTRTPPPEPGSGGGAEVSLVDQ